MKKITIKALLQSQENLPNTWFFLPPDKDRWALNTVGIFSMDSSEFEPDSEEYLPKEYLNNGWIEVLDLNTIKDIVENATSQKLDLSINELFDAFVYYYDNDSFLNFSLD